MTSSPTYLVTGVNSGLGKYLYSHIPGSLGLTRENSSEIFEQCHQIENLVILHCAYNSKRDILDYSDYLHDNVFLTWELLKLPSARFVYFSSVDLYGALTPYSFLKRASGDLVAKLASNYLILYLPAILGPHMRKNSLLRVLEEASGLTLSGDSTFNYVLQKDILEFVTAGENQVVVGKYDFVSSTNVTLNEVADYYNKKVQFGEYKYTTNLQKMNPQHNIHPIAERTSLETVKLFIEEQDDKQA